ncbi:MAG TPA: AbrB/MazE/SpoVT family DNA-binding domain-containing protein [bacterium]|nr:AbrB/MazE/SpoVT family DNA-binding domain-containing protein [bacterium]
MIKRLSKHGNSLALVIDKPILELLGIDADTPLEITTDGDGLHARPVRPEKRAQRIREGLERVNAGHGKALKRLAE